MNRPIEDVESILCALLALAATGYAFSTVKRRLELPSKARNYPAIYVYSPGEDYPSRTIRGLPPKVVIDAEIWIYADGGKNEENAPETPLNAAVRGVKTVLEPSVMADVQTLGLDDYVSHCWIEGRLVKFPGVIDGIAKAIIPVKILCKGGPST